MNLNTKVFLAVFLTVIITGVYMGITFGHIPYWYDDRMKGLEECTDDPIRVTTVNCAKECFYYTTHQACKYHWVPLR